MELPRTQYSQEFRKESVKFFKESGLTLVEAAKRLSLSKGTLKNWVYAAKRGELAEVKMERDFIKKCATYFPKLS